MSIKEEFAICYRIARIKSKVERPVMFYINFKSSLSDIAGTCLVVRDFEKFTMNQRLQAYKLSKLGYVYQRLTFYA